MTTTPVTANHPHVKQSHSRDRFARVAARDDNNACHCEPSPCEAVSNSWPPVCTANTMERTYYIYIMTNKGNRVLYTGVTGDLVNRVYQHRERQVQGFTSRYNVTKLVYFEIFNDPVNAIAREKQMKAGSRGKKVKLIERYNPEWKDLYPEIASLG